MITVTDRAKEELKAILIASEAGPDEGLRLLLTAEGKFMLSLGTELHGDLVVEYEGAKVLLVGLEYLRMLDGITVDCHNADDEPVLFVR